MLLCGEVRNGAPSAHHWQVLRQSTDASSSARIAGATIVLNILCSLQCDLTGTYDLLIWWIMRLNSVKAK